MRKFSTNIAALAIVAGGVLTGVAAPAANASPAASHVAHVQTAQPGRGQCSTPTQSVKVLVKWYKKQGVLAQVEAESRKLGFNPVDGLTFTQWLQKNIGVFELAASYTDMDNGCIDGQIKAVGDRLQRKGTLIFAVIPGKYSKKDVSEKPCSDCRRVEVVTFEFAMTSCGNFRPVKIRIVIYVHKPKPKKCKPPKVGKPPHCKKPPTPPVPVKIKKVCVTATEELETCPTGTFVFEVIDRKVKVTKVLNRDPQTYAKVKVGTEVTAEELKPRGKGKWETISPAKQHMKVHKGENVFVFKDREVPPASCPPGDTGTPPKCVPPSCPPGDTGTPPHCMPPPAHKVVGSCTGPEEITVGGTSTIPCNATDNDGDQIGIKVKTDANSNATGIICSTNGTAMCPSGGKFEFQLKGINTPSTKVTVTFYTADATSAPFTMTFDVDPSSIGYNSHEHQLMAG